MLDKTKIYTGFNIDRSGRKSYAKKFAKVKILFEDDISYYVESLDKKDTHGKNFRYSAKKDWYCFKEVIDCKTCPYKRGIERQIIRGEVNEMHKLLMMENYIEYLSKLRKKFW